MEDWAKEKRTQSADRIVLKYGPKLYHYTSYDALVGILQNKEIWMGNAASMNDRSEMQLLTDSLQKALFEDISSDKKHECQALFDSVRHALKNNYPFIFSFSMAEDDAAQWDRYSDHGEGACLVFDAHVLEELLFFVYLLRGPAFYERDVRRHQHYSILLDFFQNSALPNGFTTIEGLVSNILATSLCHKHKSFSSEKEYRFATVLYDGIQYLKSAEETVEHVRGAERKILKLHLDQLCQEQEINYYDLFCGILVGPKSPHKALEIQRLCEDLGYVKLSQHISQSECPLR